MQYAYPEIGDVIEVFGDSFVENGISVVEEVGMWLRDEHKPKGQPIYAHTAVYVGNGQIVEALGRGLTLSPLSKYNGYADVYRRDMSDYRREAIVKRALTMYREGYTYDYVEILWQFIRLIFRLDIPWHLKRSVICSVFVYDCYQAASIQIAKRRNCDPEELALFGSLTYKGRLA